MSGGLASDGHRPMRFAGAVGVELQQHYWAHVAEAAVRYLDQRKRDVLHLLLELSVGVLAAFLILGGVGNGRQVSLGPQVLDVEGQIHVLGKTLDQSMGLGERRAPLKVRAASSYSSAPRLRKAQATQMSFSRK